MCVSFQVTHFQHQLDDRLLSADGIHCEARNVLVMTPLQNLEWVQNLLLAIRSVFWRRHSSIVFLHDHVVEKGRALSEAHQNFSRTGSLGIAVRVVALAALCRAGNHKMRTRSRGCAPKNYERMGLLIIRLVGLRCFKFDQNLIKHQ